MKTTAFLRVLLSAGLCCTAQALLISCTVSTGGAAIADPPSEGKPVFNHVEIVESGVRMPPEVLLQVGHIAPGSSTSAMRKLIGTLPYAYSGSTEWYPLKTNPSVWIGLNFDDEGNYAGYRYSFNNELWE